MRFSRICTLAFAIFTVSLPCAMQAQAREGHAREIGPTGTMPLVHCVNTLQGTDSSSSFSHGNTLPLVGAPWGMTDWSPQTNSDSFYFQYNTGKIQGFRATRQPSPWMGDYGQLLIMAQTGAIDVTSKGMISEYDVNKGVWKPDYLKLELERWGITAELTATERCGVLRFTYSQGEECRLLLTGAGTSEVDVVGRKIHFRSQPGSFGAYYVLELDREIAACGTYEGTTVHAGDKAGKAKNLGLYMNFKTGACREITLKVGSSYISYEQAERNLGAEIGNNGFDEVRAKTAALWQDYLGRIEIKGATEAERNTFYSCLYRALKFPHRLYELNEAGKPIHRSPYDGNVHDGVLYADNGFWDTFRTVYSLYSLVYPKQWSEILNGWVQAYRENGSYPQWPSPGNRSCMIATHSDAIIADAIAKDIQGLDLKAAYEGLRKDAFDKKRAGQGEYLKLGFVPDGHSQYAVSTSLDYAYDDWCVAQAAQKLGMLDDYRVLMERAKNYSKLWDEGVGFMRAKKADGTWSGDFDEFAWGGPYVEGGPWQCSWAVQHDAAGLIKLMGGATAMEAKLDKMLSMPPEYHPGAYRKVIHEMSEMAALKMGQYAHNNQPVHHLLYLYTAAGAPWKTEYWTRKVCAELYHSGPQGYAGDEDNGEMSSWYVLNALGLYPLTPGRPEYVLTTPLFEQASILLENGRRFVFNAPGNNQNTVYTKARSLNGKSLSRTWIAHNELIAGGELRTTVVEKPFIRPLKPENLPYSMSRQAP